MDKKEKRTAEGLRLQKWERADADIVPIQPGDPVQQVIQTGIESIKKHRRGVLPNYPNTAEGLQMFQNSAERYFEALHDYNSALEEGRRGVLPDVEGFCIFSGISRVTLGSYAKRGGEWERFILFLKDCIAAARKQAASNYQSPPVFEIFNLKCNNDYIEKSEVKLTASTEVTEDQVQDALDHAGLKWDPDSCDYIVEDADYD